MSSGSQFQARCPVCQASIKRAIGPCWKCGTPLDRNEANDQIVVAELVSLPKQQGSFTIATLLLVTTLIAVCLALGIAAPGLGILLAIMALPPFIRTLLMVQKQKAMGKHVSNSSKVGLYLGSLGVTLIVTWVTVSATALAFCFSCLGVLAVSETVASGKAEESLLLVAGVFSLFVFALTIWAFSKWIRLRWKRDLET